MIDISSSDKEVIAALFAEQNWLDLYSLHERFRQSPGQLTSLIRKLLLVNLVEVHALKARLTAAGKQWVLANRRALFLTPRARTWADYHPTNGGHMPRDPFTPYMPELSSVRTEFFLKNRM